ncbi:FRAS1-related extracellular matrix protein 2 ECM3 -like protein NV domain-containing protein 1 [Triplophysa tibetana]|uniref:FRAS1-related extracellular matrix protein 2 ECM3-like protein NV domain-containing protein 1 n=1 Tax=Triplophysa tibetana TaxID=1572043 RepID=A0A5A9MY01_9TELE|nr:FRAS1-related extracellular matrix protein 2 ECM3 -like protein NV domain-containing protein 1 [Triplophysa tibetana]
MRAMYTKNLCMFYMKLQAKHLIPSSTIQMIVEEINGLHDICKFCRKQFFHHNFSYVQPQAIHIGSDSNRNDPYVQYIPLKETFKALFKDTVVWQQCVKNQNSAPTEQDMKYFGQEKLFSRMLSDMRDLEDNGLVTCSGHTVYTTAMCIVGDNLGQHCIGGYVAAMDDIATLIKEALPTCSTPDTPQPILDALQNLGVETVEEMKLVQMDDLAGILKPIQARKLLAHVNSFGVLVFADVWKVKVESEVKALERSCVVLPCSFKYPGAVQPSSRKSGIWHKENDSNIFIFHEDQKKIADNFKERTKLVGQLGDLNCSLEINDVKNHDNGPFCFRVELQTSVIDKYSFVQNCVRLNMIVEAPQPELNSDYSVHEGQPAVFKCSVRHTCPSHQPTLTWSHEGKEMVTCKDIGHGNWEVESILSFTPTSADDHTNITCTVQYHGLKKGYRNSHPVFVKACSVVYQECLGEGLFEITLKRTGVVKAESSDIECTVKHYGGITTRATANKKSACELIPKFSGKAVQASVDLHVQSDRVYEADVVDSLTAFPRSCVVIPCSLTMHDELAVHLWVRWFSKKGYMFHSGQSDVLDNFEGRTKLLGNPVDQDCMVEIDDVQKHDNGPFCFRAETENTDTFLTAAVCSLQCKSNTRASLTPPASPGMSQLLDKQWIIRSMGEGVWETVSNVNFIPTGFEKSDQIICSAAFWGDRTMVNKSIEVNIQSSLYPTSMRINEHGRLVVNFRTEARFRGLFVNAHSGLFNSKHECSSSGSVYLKYFTF